MTSRRSAAHAIAVSTNRFHEQASSRSGPGVVSDRVGLVALSVPAVTVWTPLPPVDAARVLLMSALGLLGQLSLTEAFTRGQAAHVAPLVYVQLVWAAVVDWLVFARLPGANTWVGAVLIIGSGLVLAALNWHAARARITGGTRAGR